jgi:hypothetical protein
MATNDGTEQHIRQIEERIDQRNDDTSAAIVRLRDAYISGALADQSNWPGRDTRSFRNAAYFDALFIEIFENVLRRPPIGISHAEWRQMLSDAGRS